MNYESINERTKDLILNIETYFNNQNNKIIYDKRNIIKIVDFENRKYVIKSFKTPHLLNKVVYRFFRESKAKRSYQNSIKLQNLHIHTPNPIGYIEFKSKLLFTKSFYISEFYNFDFEIRDVLADDKFENRDNILKEFIAFTYKLHQKKIYHIDYSAGNILIKKINAKFIFSLVDVNRMKFIDLDIDLIAKSLAKLTTNSRDNEYMLNEYSKLSNIDIDTLKNKFNIYFNQHQKYLKNKKRLKWQ